jgi:L-amino acid N-acyltransferase YncA
MSTSTDPLRIREMVETDWPAVAAIYAAGIATGNATFETQVPSWERWSARGWSRSTSMTAWSAGPRCRR